MDMETARVMLQLLLGKHWPLFTQFAQFLDQSKYKVINKDQWCNILEFSRTINHDLSNYDLDGACKYSERSLSIGRVIFQKAHVPSYVFLSRDKRKAYFVERICTVIVKKALYRR